ncbi:DMT family transporter [Oceanobacillus senegalensis]|uniref:DMT family transporter n=1 Tax=Oceanobacillus senegalensis TaxID=1936063 RepID=UPI000A30B59B|nr:DMT family transporter [Oceanobacillus senegalensis]
MSKQEGTLLSILRKRKSLVRILILIVTILWGYAWVLMKASLEFMGPFAFSSYRFGIGAVTSLLIVYILKVGLPPKKYWKHLVVLGMLQTSAVFLLVMFALRYVEAGKSSVLLYSMPIWSSILAVKILGEKLTTMKIAGLSVGMLGLLTIFGWDIWTGQSIKIIFGEILIIIAAVTWAVSNIYYRLKLQELSQLQVNAFQMLFGAIGIFSVTIIMEWGEPVILNIQSIYYVLFTGILASALCFTVWFIIMGLVDMVTATISTLLVPIFGLLFSSLLLEEEMTVSMFIGSSMIIVGIALAQLKNPRQA